MDDATTSQAAMDPVWEQALKNEGEMKDKGYDELLADANLQYQILSDLNRYGQQGEWVFERLLLENVAKDVAKYIILYRSEDGNIDRHLVVKVVGHEYYEQMNTETSEEFRIHRNMSRLGCPHIASCYGRSWRQVGEPDPEESKSNEDDTVKVNYLGMGYLEYLTGGDLMALADGYGTKQVPEGLVWIIFRGVAEAIYAWTTGRVLSFDEPQTGSLQSQWNNDSIPIEPNWPIYLNYDLKPDNICLGAAGRVGFPAFPTPKVIDFGVARAWQNREKFRGEQVGAEGLISPEVLRSELPGIEMEIWGLGISILNLISTDLMGWDEGDEQLEFDEPDRAYSQKLIDLVNECVSIDKHGRPQLMELLVRTREGFEQWERATVPMRNKTKEELGPIGTFVMPTDWKDEYYSMFRRHYDDVNIPRRSTSPRGHGSNADPGDDSDDDGDNDQGGGEARHESPEQTILGSLKFALQRFAEIYTDLNRDPQNPEHRQRLRQARVHRENLENELLRADDIQHQEQEPTAQVQQDRQHDQRQDQPQNQEQDQPQDQEEDQPQDQEEDQAQDQQPDEEQHNSPPAPKQRHQAKAKTHKTKGTKAKVTKAGTTTQAKGSRAKTGGGRSQAAPPAANQPRSLRRNRAAPGDYKKFM